MTSPSTGATSAAMSSISRRIRRARSTTRAPSSVSPPWARSTSAVPSSFSRRAMWLDTLDCTVNRARAAAENVPWSAMATRAGELTHVHLPER